eukprot:scaffold243338_cov31-Tisochrysis_lutea.AAC.8
MGIARVALSKRISRGALEAWPKAFATARSCAQLGPSSLRASICMLPPTGLIAKRLGLLGPLPLALELSIVACDGQGSLRCLLGVSLSPSLFPEKKQRSSSATLPPSVFLFSRMKYYRMDGGHSSDGRIGEGRRGRGERRKRRRGRPKGQSLLGKD